ncbi:MAG: iron-sulfur cluster carrier protein [Lysobacterales bacterium]|jgi:ATP-binding protein involved in chromosome partitioning|nr:MAG: iron-sulfur cluster carrier protein [Xanthomonadales bacterium]
MRSESVRSEEAIRALLAGLRDPHTGRSLGEDGSLKGVGIAGERVLVDIVLAYPAAGWRQALMEEVRSLLRERLGLSEVTVSVAHRIHAHEVQAGLTPLPEVKNILAVASGKGGVGKSAIAVNLALALAAEGARAGVLDADLYGPSLPTMTGTIGPPGTTPERRILPKRAHGLELMSIGYLLGEDAPVIWRGPMATQALQQLLTETAWEGLDYLVIDLPPGTGDIQLTLCQRVPLSGAVIVTTPQDLSLVDAQRALKMFEKVAVPVLGVVENMSLYRCPHCGHEEAIFGTGAGERIAARYGVPLLGRLPLDPRIRADADGGLPTVAADPESEHSLAFRAIARKAAAQLSLRARSRALSMPRIVIE